MTRKSMAVFTAITMIAALLPINTKNIQAASAPAFAITTDTITLQGVGNINKYTLRINNTEKYKDFSFVWTSSNSKIVKIPKPAGQGDEQNGYYCNLVPKGKGTAEIKCVVSYVTKKNVQKQKVLKANVEVTIPSDRSEDNCITNKVINDENTQTQYIYEGESYPFEGAISPVGSSDNIYWKSTDESIFTVDEKGVVTGVEEGAAVLEMYVGATEESALARDKLDSMKIRIIARPKVKSIQLTDANTLAITFTQSVTKSTVVSGSGLTENISIIPTKKDDREGRDLGKIYAVLNGKTLIVTTENEFSGVYQFIVTSDVTTTEQINIAPYDEIKKVILSLE